uniref:Uncharacterized protein n=1 Tax=Cacopsylla melanoneura TaxID=428564 RepID=A0A8D8ZBU8_9HEMI
MPGRTDLTIDNNIMDIKHNMDIMLHANQNQKPEAQHDVLCDEFNNIVNPRTLEQEASRTDVRHHDRIKYTYKYTEWILQGGQTIWVSTLKLSWSVSYSRLHPWVT